MTSHLYRKVGRGGAGNFYNQQDLENASKKINEDIEAQSAAVDARALTSDRPCSDYAHAGRGGAGNWYSPADVQKYGDFLSQIVARNNVMGAREAGYYGRGGVGNFTFVGQEQSIVEEKKILEEQGKQKEKMVRYVSANLERPEKAHLGAQGLNKEDENLA